MLKVSIIPALLIAGFIALQSFQSKEPVSHQLDDPPVWFTLDPLGDETEPTDYTEAPGYNPSTNGCTGSEHMCAVKTQPDENGDPILYIESGRVVIGDEVEAVARTLD